MDLFCSAIVYLSEVNSIVGTEKHFGPRHEKKVDGDDLVFGVKMMEG